ncbi:MULTISPECIES: lasso peptide biosynthesis B2 protein [unclassified Sphingomonas]|uniref:lasso peptide biosynthesis B2 protein n=1 Tax=unclassified Sphingomonas TaxID=196159 RepID=UPI0006FF0093|nr:MULTISPECIES: lasso peptide biosynthesis B2 protein [unclassified Sphingomonas]KQX17781.1 hypothetical protein ASD17_18885 [Sphingomonas sp. Root1294]KQY70707.1 hypothetical protein ASD39_22785 [Sphingomonas sp. Root50]KRB91799.1 hypothetical protein ASE22_07525 [Sphingomonas sp. Root720]
MRGAETAFALALAWLLIFVIPLRFTLARLGSSACGDRPRAAPSDQAQLIGRSIAARVAWLSRRLPLDVMCLQRALAALLMLRRRGIRTVIRFGVRRLDDSIGAHAWLMLGDVVLLGEEEAAGFVPIADLGEGFVSRHGA